MTKARDPKIHWFAFDCHHFDHHMRDSFTNMPMLVTCGICKRHVEFILPGLLSRICDCETPELLDGWIRCGRCNRIAR
jgi:hypothetical protein